MRFADVTPRDETAFSFRDAERRLWLEGADAFRDFLHAEALMALPARPPILAGDAILASLEGMPGWDDVTFRSVRESRAGDSHAFAYEAEGARGDDTYRAACLSVWTLGDDGWRLLTHSQTPVTEDG